MILRLYNLALAGTMAYLLLGTRQQALHRLDPLPTLLAFLTVCWLVGSVGLFFERRFCRWLVLLGCGVLSAFSLALLPQIVRLLPITSDPTSGLLLLALSFVGLASSLRDRNPMTDGFGLIAFASLTPMIFVMAYGGIIRWL